MGGHPFRNSNRSRRFCNLIASFAFNYILAELQTYMCPSMSDSLLHTCKVWDTISCCTSYVTYLEANRHQINLLQLQSSKEALESKKMPKEAFRTGLSGLVNHFTTFSTHQMVRCSRRLKKWIKNCLSLPCTRAVHVEALENGYLIFS